MNKKYKLKPSDFIPVIGLTRHHKRCANELERLIIYNETSQDNLQKYTENSFARDTLLLFYNMSIIGVSYLITSGLAELLPK